MAFDGNGNFNRVYNWTQDKANGINITASRVDTEDTGFAAGLTLCVTRDGQGKMGANFLPSADATYDLGSAGAHWNNLFLSANANVGGTLGVTGNATLGGTLTVTGALTANGVSVPTVITKLKTANTTRANNTTLSADPELQVTLSATSGVYAFELWITDTPASTSPGGLKGSIAYSGSLSGTPLSVWGMVGSGTGTNNVPLVSVNVVGIQFQSTQNGQGNMWVTGILEATSAGTLSFNWAQNSSNAIASIVGAGSWMRITKLA